MQGAPDWPRIIVGGHSNGADNAAFLSKVFGVSRALVFSGPQDYVGIGGHDDPGDRRHARSAPWQYWAGATDPSRRFGFGVAGSAAHPNSWECHVWHTGWEAERIRPPYVAVDDGLATGQVSSWRGARRLVSDGGWASPIANLTPWWHAHMGAAGDCCSPRSPTGTALVWEPVLRHMLLSDLADLPDPAAPSQPGCGNITRSVPPPPTPPAAVFDFRGFEADVLQPYLHRFKVPGSGIAGYGAVPRPSAATPYGGRAAVKALFIVNQLNITEAQRDEWAAFFDSFQNSTGCWSNYSKTGDEPTPFDTLYLGTWEVTDALGLIGRPPRFNNSAFEAIAADPAAWGPNFLPIFNGTQTGCGNIHGCGHKTAAVGVVLAATGHLGPNAAFFEWLLRNAEAHLDPANGEICPALCSNSSLPECSNTLYDCLGGGMTYHSMLTYLGRPWPRAAAVQNLALKLQKPDGLWSYMSDSMNFDGIYQLSRPCRQRRCSPSILDRIKAACSLYVKAAHQTLATIAAAEAVFDADFHHFPVCLATLAECQSWFPAMVRTSRPWRTQTFP